MAERSLDHVPGGCARLLSTLERFYFRHIARDNAGAMPGQLIERVVDIAFHGLDHAVGFRAFRAKYEFWSFAAPLRHYDSMLIVSRRNKPTGGVDSGHNLYRDFCAVIQGCLAATLQEG